jgi:DNA-binding response OmpR family regulator
MRAPTFFSIRLVSTDSTPPNWIPTILIVDDHKPVLQSLDHILGRSGYRVICADSAASAIMLASTEPFDLALIDIHLPSVNGFECLRIIRQNLDPSRGGVRVWFMTGAPTPEITRAATNVGALGVLAKPFDLVELLATLKEGLAAPAPRIVSTAP